MENSPRYPWQQTVIDAFLASREELPLKINTAERAIAARIAEDNEPDVEERIAIDDALRALKMLMAEMPARSSPARTENRKKDTA